MPERLRAFRFKCNHLTHLPGCYARTVVGIREERTRLAMRALDWIVIPNRVRWAGARHQARFEQLTDSCAFRLGSGLPERVEFRDLPMMGLTQYDLRRVPGIATNGTRARRDLKTLIADLALPEAPLLDRMTARADLNRNRPRGGMNFRTAGCLATRSPASCSDVDDHV